MTYQNSSYIQQVHIQQIDVRTRGLSAHTVRTALSSIESALQTEVSQLHQQNRLQGQRRVQQQGDRTVSIPHLQTASIQSRGDTQQLRQAIARSIAQGISQSLSRSSD